MTAHGLIETAKHYGVTLWTEYGKLKYRSAQGEIPADLRRELVEHRDALIRTLGVTPAETCPPSRPSPPSWNQAAAIRETIAADDWAAEQGRCDHPRIQMAAMIVADAMERKDTDEFRAAIGLFRGEVARCATQP